MLLTIVAEDQILLNDLRFHLDGEKDIALSGAYLSHGEALASLDSCIPEIMLVEMRQPRMDGINLIGKVKKRNPDVEILVYTAFEDRDSIISAFKAGATGYILRESEPRDIVHALRVMRGGGAPISPRIARRVINELHGNDRENPFLLSIRERDILRDIKNGLSYKMISSIRNLSVHTVHAHVTHIFRKLLVKNRKEALQKASEMGII